MNNIDDFEDADSPLRKARASASRSSRCALAGLFFVLFALVLISVSTSYRDIPHYLSSWRSTWRYYRDNGLGSCRLRKEPLFLVKSSSSLETVFELTCPSKPRTTLSKISMDNNLTAEIAVLDSSSSSKFKFKIEIPGELVSADFIISLSFLGYPLKTLEQSEKLKIGLISDSQNGIITFRQHLSLIRDQNPSIVIHNGDLIQESHQLEQWQLNFFDPVRENLFSLNQSDGSVHQLPLIVVPGNHDTRYGPKYGFETRYWDINLNGAQFVILDWKDSKEMQDWFLERLKSYEWKSASFRIILCHTPPFIEFWEPIVWKQGEYKWGDHIRDFYLPNAKRHQLDAFIGGHSHLYQRGSKDGVYYFIVGGGGGSLETDRVDDYKLYSKTELGYHHVMIELSRCELLWTANDINGNNFDQLVLTSRTC